MIDCRTCKNLSERSGGCMSVVKCISGSCYRDTAAVQLFEGPAPTVEPVAWRYTIHGSMILTPDRCLADLAAWLGIDVEPLYLRGPLRDPTQETKT